MPEIVIAGCALALAWSLERLGPLAWAFAAVLMFGWFFDWRRAALWSLWGLLAFGVGVSLAAL